MSLVVEFGEIVEALRDAGLNAGDLVVVHSRLFTLGPVRGVAATSDTPAVYLRAFQDTLGAEGTIVVPTYTTSFGRFGRPFVYETSPSEMGMFSEYVRTRPGSRRTLHPILSLAALGPQAEALTNDHPRWNVGHDTIWDRLHRQKAKVLSMGLPLRQCLSFVHHVEYLACVPYLYHKLLRGDVSAGGARIPYDFVSPVRYLQHDVVYDLSRLDRDLETLGAITHAPLGADWIHLVGMDVVFEACMSGLRHDPYYLLQRPPTFVEGEPPCDGPTSEREAVLPDYFQVLA